MRWGLSFFLAFVCTGFAFAQDTDSGIYVQNDFTIERKIADLNQKNTFIPDDFNLLVKRNQAEISKDYISLHDKILYQKRLLHFLDFATSKELFQNGKYTQILNYNISLIRWHQENKLYENITLYPVFSFQAFALFSDDSAAYRFLNDYVSVIPDEILRKAPEFSSDWYAKTILRKVLEEAPYSIKQYFTGISVVSDFLKNDITFAAITERQIFYKLPFKTKAYVFLEQLSKNQMSLATADSIGQNRERLFKAVTQTLSLKAPLGKYSLNKELVYTCELIARDLSMSSEAPTMSYNQIIALSKEEILTLLVFGYKDLLAIDFDNLISILQRKPVPVNRYLLENLSVKSFSGLIKYTQKRELLEQLVKGCGENNSDIIKALLSYEEPNYYLIPETAAERAALILSEKNSIKENSADSISTPVSESNAAAKQTLVTNAKKTEEFVAPVSFDFSNEDKAVLKLKQNIFKTLQNIPSIIDEPFAKELLMYASQIEPDEVLKKVEQYKSKYFCKEVVEAASLMAPVSLKRYLANPTHVVNILLKKSENDFIKKMFEINTATGFKTKSYLLINQLVRNEMGIDEAIAVSIDKDKLFKEMAKTLSDENAIGKYSVGNEMEIYSLRYIRDINDKIDVPENIRFAGLDTLTANQLYYITVFGREEVFNTTFNGIFAKLESKFDFQNIKTFEALMKLPKFSLFISLCASYDKLDKLLAALNKEQKRHLISNFVAQLHQTNNSIENAVSISEAITNISNPEIQYMIQQQIKKEYESCEETKNTHCMASYGILAGLCKDKEVFDPAWFNLMSKKYPAGDMATLKLKTLQQSGKIIERMYFYDDDDGRDSYYNFLSVFKNNTNWLIDDYFNYTKVSSVSGTPILIFANKPSFEESGDQAIKKLLSDNQWEPSILIHRGHSFHTQKSLENIPDQTKLLFVGSCGGFYKASSVLKSATQAQIIATKQIGAKIINDPMIFAINDELRKGSDIQWPSFWSKMKTQLGGYSLFYDYVPPHKNIEALFQNAYYKTLGL